MENVSSAPVKKSTILWLFVALTVLFAGTSAYLYKQNYDLKKNPDILAEKEEDALIERVGKFMVLPKDERPTIATVTDLAALKGQPFFDRAQIGDKVLIYSVAKKAILFNPSENKVVEVAPINDEPAPASKPAEPEPEKEE